MTGVPDAWDECGVCGHDRDDHPPTGCMWPGCDCDRFTEEEDG